MVKYSNLPFILHSFLPILCLFSTSKLVLGISLLKLLKQCHLESFAFLVNYNRQLQSPFSNFSCSDDSDLIADADFSAIYTSVPLINRYYVTLYVFQFYNSENVYFECDVKVCPSGSSACDIVRYFNNQ